MTKLATDSDGHAIPAIRPGTVQTVSVSSASAAVSNFFAARTTIIRIVSTTDCHYVVNDSPTATTSDTFLPANAVEFVRVNGGDSGDKIAFIRNASDGTAYITEGTN